MDHTGNLSHPDHTIDIPRNDVTSLSTSHQDDHNDLDEFHGSRAHPDEVPAVPGSSSGTHDVSNSQNASSAIELIVNACQIIVAISVLSAIQLIVNVSQIIAAISVLLVSRNEHPHAPLSVWLLGYTIGCIVDCIGTLLDLYWRYHCNRQNMEQELPTQSLSERNISETNSFAAVSSPHALEAVDGASRTGVSRNNLPMASPMFYSVAQYCMFAVWIVGGNVWLVVGNMLHLLFVTIFRICIVFLVFGFITYTFPFILCTMHLILCIMQYRCLPYIISILGVHEDLDLNRGATMDTINALVAYKFKSKRVHDGDVGEDCGGVLAAGTEKERTISAEDAICCICLSKFSNNEDLRELPCMHVFHMECIDKWLQINALCPLCKSEIGGSKSVPETDPGGPQDNNRVGNDVESQR
ncbi:E3 ubiquitin-protein ligase [Dichanthelium oligosanthes]|uniref:E3 ubiquitin-protein ligase n=1 Tax=Dichanthelium oligosanthes TaxID=888268 RepID=A0A1E5W397_9POAL|nr:E3 ubiquitin-protein ligase [Dichanthelium oligosanthes]